MRAAAEAGIDIPKLCATDSLKAYGSCRMCLVEVDRASRHTPASCTTPCSDGMVGADQHRAGPGVAPRGDGALSLRTPRRTAPVARAATARSRRWPYASAPPRSAMAVPVARSVRSTTPTPISPSTTPRASSAHVACARAARCRAPSRSPHRRPRLRVVRISSGGTDFLVVGMCLVRRLRPGLPHQCPHREVDHRPGHADALGGDHLRLLRRRLHLPRRGPGRGRRHPRRPDDARQDRWRQRGPQLRQGPVRVRLCRPR
jgi:hypothetical protein